MPAVLRYGGASTRGSAVRLKEGIEARSGAAVWVQGVVAVWGELAGGTVTCDRVVYVPAAELTETLCAQLFG